MTDDKHNLIHAAEQAAKERREQRMKYLEEQLRGVQDTALELHRGLNTCPACNGSKVIPRPIAADRDRFDKRTDEEKLRSHEYEAVDCPMCDGSGEYRVT